MSASSRGSRAAMPLLRRAPTICSQCARGQFSAPARRPYSASATATPVETTTTSPPPTESSQMTPNTYPPPPPPVPKSEYRLRGGVILSRPPILTELRTPFEQAFYLYQKRLNERLVGRFSPKFYFKKDQPPLTDFRIKLRERGHTMAKEIGQYWGHGDESWNDEVPVGSDLSDLEKVREKLFTDAEMRVSEDGEELSFEDRVRLERPLPRETEADRTNDVRRLDRKLDRTLYLLVRDGSGRWGFPATTLSTEDTLHEAAARALSSAAGVNMNVWMVGRQPVGHVVDKPWYKDDTMVKAGAKTFFLKGRIMAGQADLKDNSLGLTDFKWLTKDEIAKEVDIHYYTSIRNTMPSR